MKQIFLIVILMLYASDFSVKTQTLPAVEDQNSSYVFLLGNYEEHYTEIVKSYPENLLTICNDSIDLAYQHWMMLLLDMEKYGESIAFDLRGLKIWMNVFWNKDGSIDYISYYPKPNCKNMDFEELTVFFNEFIKQHKAAIPREVNFSHYGSASFPSHAEMFISERSGIE